MMSPAYSSNPLLARELVDQFLRLKGIVMANPGTKLFATAEFVGFLRHHLNVRKSTTLTGRTVGNEFFIDGVLVHVDERSRRPFYIYY